MNVAWIKSNTSITANTTTSPNGTLTADTLSIGVDASAVRHRLSQSITATIGTTYTGTYYLKANQHQWIQIVAVSGFSTGVWANFDLVNGTIGNTGGVDTTASIENVGGGWYRCRVGGVATATSTTGFEILTTNNTNSGRYPSYQSLVAENVCYVWGAQIVEGSSAETYLPTTDRLGFPRLDYSFSSCPGVWVEGQRTNLFLQSEAFDTASWIKNASSVTANTTTSPDGTTNADTLTSTATSNVLILQTPTIVSGTTYSTTFYAKQNTQRFIYIRFTSNAVADNYVSVVFDLQDGTVGQTSVGTTSGTLVSATATSSANGFYRITVIASINRTDGNIGIGFASAKTGNTFSTAGTITSSVTNGNSLFLWGVQVEAGAYPSTYIPTTTASATRLSDTNVISGISSLIGQTQGVVFFDMYYNLVTNGGFRVFASLEGTVSGVFSGFSIGTGNNFNNVQFSGLNYNIPSNGRYKVACLYNSTTNTSKLFVNGVLRGTGTFSGFVNTISQISMASRINTFSGFAQDRQAFVPIYNFAIFPTALTDAQCVALTT